MDFLEGMSLHFVGEENFLDAFHFDERVAGFYHVFSLSNSIPEIRCTCKFLLPNQNKVPLLLRKKPAISLKTKHRPRLLAYFVVVPRGDHDLLVAQSHDRIDPRGPPRRHIASDNRNHDDDAQRDEVHGHVAGMDAKEKRLAQACKPISRWQSHNHSGKNHPAYLLEYQRANIPTACAE